MKYFYKIVIFSVMIFGIIGCSAINKNDVSPEIPETVKWINSTYAILIEINDANHNIFGGLEPSILNTGIAKKTLEEWWDIKNKEEAQRMIQNLQKGYHNSDFLEEVKYYTIDSMTNEEFEEALKNVDDENDVAYFRMLKDVYDKYGENAILAWDLCRANSLLGYYYIAEYYTYEEALDEALEISKLIQKSFNSWDEMAESYLFGHQYWQGDNPYDEESESYQRIQVYDKLKNKEDSPYNIDWNLELKKQW